MSRKVFSFCIACLFLLVKGLCQPGELNRDSLLRELARAKEDTGKVLLLIAVGQQFELNNPDTAAHFYKAAGRLSQKLNYPIGIIKYISNYTAILNVQGKFEESMRLNREGLDISRKYQLVRQTAVSLGNIASVYSYQGDNLSAASYYLQALPYFEQLKDSTSLSILYSNLAKCYQSMKLYVRAEEYGKSSIAFAGDKPWALGYALLNTGVAITGQGRLREAMHYFDSSYRMGLHMEDDLLVESSLMNQADIYTHWGQYSRGIATLDRARRLGKKISDENSVSLIYRQLAWIYYRQQDLPLSRVYLDSAIAAARRNRMMEDLRDAYELSVIEEAAADDPRQTVFYDSLRHSLDDSLFSTSIARNMEELNTRYQTEKRQAEIEALNKEKQIQQLSIKQHAILNYLLAGSSVAILSIFFLSYRNSRNKQKLSQQTGQLQSQRIRELEQEQQLVSYNALLKGQEEERSRMAKDLHDGVGGMLSGIKLSLSAMRGNAILSEDNARLFAQALLQLDNSMAELRRVAHNMMPEALVRLGLEQAIQDYCDHLNESGTIRIKCQFHGLETRLEAANEIVVYRIVQELVNNIIRHAAASEALVQLMRNEDLLSIIIEDNGRGFDLSAVPQGGAGLGNVRSRVDYLHGVMDVRAEPGKGVSVHIECPLG